MSKLTKPEGDLDSLTSATVLSSPNFKSLPSHWALCAKRVSGKSELTGHVAVCFLSFCCCCYWFFIHQVAVAPAALAVARWIHQVAGFTNSTQFFFSHLPFLLMFLIFAWYILCISYERGRLCCMHISQMNCFLKSHMWKQKVGLVLSKRYLFRPWQCAESASRAYLSLFSIHKHSYLSYTILSCFCLHFSVI